MLAYLSCRKVSCFRIQPALVIQGKARTESDRKLVRDTLHESLFGLQLCIIDYSLSLLVHTFPAEPFRPGGSRTLYGRKIRLLIGRLYLLSHNYTWLDGRGTEGLPG